MTMHVGPLSLSSWLLALTLGFICPGCAQESAHDPGDQPRLVTSLPSKGTEAWHLATHDGRIVLSGSCVRVESDAPDGTKHSSTLVFPSSYPYTLVKDHDEIWMIRDSTGKKWAKIGELRKVTGGEIDGELGLAAIVPEGDRRRCPSPFWRLTPDEAGA